MLIAQWLVWTILAYCAVGLVVGAAFVVRGVQRVDAGARGAPMLFRVLILPGAAALWPVVLRWWLRARGGHP